jgi:hypothetical protein
MLGEDLLRVPDFIAGSRLIACLLALIRNTSNIETHALRKRRRKEIVISKTGNQFAFRGSIVLEAK